MRTLGWILATLVVAAVVHVGSVLLLPHLIMHRVIGAVAHRGINTMLHTPRPTAAARGVVRPSPDLLYSTCVFDLSRAGGALRVSAHDMPKTYWSISIFDANTNNIFVLDDRQAKGRPVEITIVGPGSTKPLPGIVVYAPEPHGLVLVRTLIDSDAHLAAVDKARRNATCGAAN